MCIKLNLIEGNASRNKNYTRQHYEEWLEELLEECERIDEEEKEEGSWVKMEKELAEKEEYRTRIREILKQFEDEEGKGNAPKTINQTGPESA